MAATDTSPDAPRLLRTRGLRALVDGLVAVVLPAYLLARGFNATEVGAIVTATLLGSAAVSLTIGLRGGRFDRVHLLQVMAGLMILTGLAFGLVATFGVLLVVAAVGTLNPSSGDVSAFLPIEQALLPDTVPTARRTHAFARYSLVAALAGAFGALAAGIPGWVAKRTALSELEALQGVFFFYALVGVALLVAYRRLAPRPPVVVPGLGRSGLGRSRAIVMRLSALFSLDAFGGGFAVQSILVLWLSLRFGLSTAQSGAVFFWSGLLTASSALLAPRIAGRIGLIRTMVFTHIPASLLLISAALMPTAGLAVACLLARAAALADGCARPHELRDGGGRPGGAHRGGDHHQRPPQPGLRPPAARGRLAAAADRLRLAPDHRRAAQDHLRPRPAGPLPRRPPARGARRPPAP